MDLAEANRSSDSADSVGEPSGDPAVADPGAQLPSERGFEFWEWQQRSAIQSFYPYREAFVPRVESRSTRMIEYSVSYDDRALAPESIANGAREYYNEFGDVEMRVRASPELGYEFTRYEFAGQRLHRIERRAGAQAGDYGAASVVSQLTFEYLHGEDHLEEGVGRRALDEHGNIALEETERRTETGWIYRNDAQYGSDGFLRLHIEQNLVARVDIHSRVGSHSISFERDSEGRVLRSVEFFDDTVPHLTVEYEYDARGALVRAVIHDDRSGTVLEDRNYLQHDRMLNWTVCKVSRDSGVIATISRRLEYR